MSTDPFPSPGEIASADGELVAIVRRQLPRRFYEGARWWGLWRAASLVRMADTVESLMVLMASDQSLDGQTLVRSLYEQVVTFAWVAIDPDTRQWCWIGDGRSSMLKLHNDAMGFVGPILTDDQVTTVRASLGLSEPRPEPEGCGGIPERRNRPDPERVLPPLSDRALEADEYWPPLVRGLHGRGHPLSFRGLYLVAYRIPSRAVHSSLLALDAYLSREPERPYVVNRAEPGPRIMWALIGPLSGIALLIAARWENWIDETMVRELIDRATGPEQELRETQRLRNDAETAPNHWPRPRKRHP